MRRAPPANSERYRYGVHCHYALFIWKKCVCCEQEFRREKGWQYTGGPFYNGGGKRYYLCATCAHDRNTAHELACGGVHIPSAPPPPPVAKPSAS